MISNITNLSPHIYHNITASGKLFVPVNPSAVIYAQFDHISGIAATQGQNGVSVSKIQILNSLIENLARIRSTPASKPQVTEAQADALIKKYSRQLADTSRANPIALTGARPDAGSLFSINA